MIKINLEKLARKEVFFRHDNADALKDSKYLGCYFDPDLYLWISQQSNQYFRGNRTLFFNALLREIKERADFDSDGE